MDEGFTNVAEHPITQSEVQALIEPLRGGIQRMESKLLEFLESSVLQKDVLQELAGEMSSFKLLRNQSKSDMTADGSGDEATQLLCASDSGMGINGSIYGPGSSNKERSWEEAMNNSESKIVTGSSNEESMPNAPIYPDACASLQGAAITDGSVATGTSTTNVDTARNSENLPTTPSTVLTRAYGKGKKKLEVTDEAALKGALDMIEHHKIDKAFEEFRRRDYYKMTFADKMVAYIDTYAQMWNNIAEPERDGFLFRLTRSRPFDFSCQCAIVANSLLVAYMSDWQIQHIGEKEPLLLDMLESFFVIFFTFELVVRLGAHRLYFFVNHDMHWNIFDTFLVIISLIDFFISKVLHSEANSNIGFMRLLRLMKLARIFRSLRLFRFLKSLAVLLESFQNSIISLFWGCIMMAFVLYMFALIFVQAFIGYLNHSHTHDEPIPRQQRVDIEQDFGTLGRTILTLYSAVTGGQDWMAYSNLLFRTGATYGLLFVFFTFFATFAVFNLITGLLVEKAINTSKPDRADQILNQRRRFAQQKSEFMEICSHMDLDKNGKISWPEFKEWHTNPVMMAYMASIGIDIKNVELFFATVGARHDQGDDNSPGYRRGEVSCEAFVEGCMHMKGAATALDMQRTLFEMHLLQLDVTRLQGHFEENVCRLEKFIGKCFRSLNKTLLATESSSRFPL